MEKKSKDYEVEGLRKEGNKNEIKPRLGNGGTSEWPTAHVLSKTRHLTFLHSQEIKPTTEPRTEL